MFRETQELPGRLATKVTSDPDGTDAAWVSNRLSLQ
jgi:hypothetical protein